MKEINMKNMKVLFVSILAVTSIFCGLNAGDKLNDANLQSNGAWNPGGTEGMNYDFTPYITGKGVDEEDNNGLHLLAASCIQGNLKEEIDKFVLALEKNNIDEEVFKSFFSAKNNKGYTPSELARSINNDVLYPKTFFQMLSIPNEWRYNCIIAQNYFETMSELIAKKDKN